VNVSVIATAYNQEKYLPDAIESLLGQTVRPYEIIICDDFSTEDETRQVIKGYAGRYPDLIKPILQTHNVGIAANRNAGFKTATGEFITWLDGDDRFLPNKIERELETLANSPADIAYSNVYVTDTEFNRLKTRYKPGKQLDGNIFEAIATRRLPPPLMMLIPKKCFEEVGFLDESLQIYEDWEWKIRLASRFLFTSCPEPLYEYRQHPGGMHHLPLSAHLDIMIKIAQRAIDLCNISMVPDKEKTKQSIKAFLAILQAKNTLLSAKMSGFTTFVRKFLDIAGESPLLAAKASMVIFKSS
jgi:glycosyltransferase involved in cell wall biosynthesis